MSKQPLLSVIVPIYNAEKFLDRCVRSLVEQTYRNLEIFLIDDGSKDRSGAIANHWASVDQRVRVFHTENRGVSHARNVGLDHARGEWITFVDADDWLEADMYALMIEGVETHDVDVCVGSYTMDIEATNDPNPTRATPLCSKGQPQIFSRDETLINVFSFKEPKLFGGGIWDKIFRRELVDGLRFDESISRGQDTLFGAESLIKAKATLYLPLLKYHYVIHSQSTVHKKISLASLTALRGNDLIRRKLENESEEVRAAFDEWYFVVLIGVLRVLMVLKPDEFERRIREGQSFIRRHLFHILRTNIKPTSARILLIAGACFFTLPFSICKLLRPLIRLKTD